jgi:hypothetical protein
VPKERIRLQKFSIGRVRVGVNIDSSGYLVAMTRGRYASYHKLCESQGRVFPTMFAAHTIGEYRVRETEREERYFMSDQFFFAHCEAVRRYVSMLRRNWKQRLVTLGKEHWVPDRMFEATDTGRIVLSYGEHVLFFQRRDPKRAKKERKEPTKYVHWTLDAKHSATVTDLKVTEEDFTTISRWPNKWAEFFPDKRASMDVPARSAR